MKKVLLWSMLAMLIVSSMLLTACSGDDGEICYVTIDLGYLYEEAYGADGREIELEVKSGTLLTEPELREIEGYTFDKWIVWEENSTGYSEWSFDTPVTSSGDGYPHIRIEALYVRDQFTYKLNEAGDGYIAETLLYVDENSEYCIIVPDTYKGLPVVEIADGACDSDVLREKGISLMYVPRGLRIGKNVTRIGDRAFVSNIRCSTATDGGIESIVTIPANVKEIGEAAFEGCYVTQLILPEGLTEIKPSTFKFFGVEKELKIPSTVTKIGAYAFEGFYLVSNDKDAKYDYDFVIPNGVTEIGEGAFKESALTRVMLPAGITSIPMELFDACEDLTRVTVQNGVTIIGEGAFRGSNLSDGITLPNTLTVIEKEAFSRTSLSSVTLPASLKTIGEGAFRGTSLTAVVIPAGVETIGAEAFRSNGNLATVELPDTLKRIGNNAFRDTAFYETLREESSGLYYGQYLLGNTGYVNYSAEITEGTVLIADGAFGVYGMEYLTLPASLRYIGEKAFAGATGLREIVIPEGVIEIGAYAFSGCNSLCSATLPESLQSMKEGVFSKCGMLESVTLPSNLTAIPDETFLNCTALAEISIPNGVTKIGKSAFQGCEALSGVTLPEGVTELGAYVFCGCDSLTQITLPAGIKVVPSYAFADSGLVSVELPDGLMMIMDHAFERCKLQSLNLPTATPLSIWDEAFLGNLQLTELVLPENVISIYPRAFAGCDNLTSVTILHAEGGWKMTHPELGVNQGGRKTFTCDELSDPAVVARYLTSDYLAFQWAYDPELVK